MRLAIFREILMGRGLWYPQLVTAEDFQKATEYAAFVAY